MGSSPDRIMTTAPASSAASRASDGMRSARRVRAVPVVEEAVAKTGLRMKAYYPAGGFQIFWTDCGGGIAGKGKVEVPPPAPLHGKREAQPQMPPASAGFTPNPPRALSTKTRVSYSRAEGISSRIRCRLSHRSGRPLSLRAGPSTLARSCRRSRGKGPGRRRRSSSRQEIRLRWPW